MNLFEARQLALELFRKHKLTCSFSFNSSRRSCGRCLTLYNGRISIQLSKHHVLANNEEIVTDTILHEIAHALVGNHNNHNVIWQNKAAEIGAEPTKYVAINKINIRYGYQLTCSSCGNISYMFGKPRLRRSCSQCSPGRFNENFILTVQKIHN